MMKKLALLLSACLLLAAVAYAAGGEDSLVSLSYLTGTFLGNVEDRVDQKLDQSDEAILEQAADGELDLDTASTWREIRLKRGDLLTGSTGTNVLLLAGSGRVTYGSGAVVDVTTGTQVSSGTALAANHRYIVAEDTAAAFEITSRTAVVDYQGGYSFAYSNEVDYNAMAAALKSLNLFRGSFTGYGEGFDLELSPTRLQALIMFIRVLGEEEQALAWTGTTHFTDISKGSDAEKYVGYAYEKGYTNGYSATQFKPGNPVNAGQYTEFVLRAMGYSSAANTDLSDTLLRAEQAGVLTSGETARLQMEKFRRADLVYISYYALYAQLPDSWNTLADALMDKGVFSMSAWRNAERLVTSSRL